MSFRSVPSFVLSVVLASTVLAGQSGAPQNQGRWPDTLKERDVAPDFKLSSIDGKSTFQLSSQRGKKPVVLIFGSYT